MCGIIGYVGPKKVQPLLLHGLQRLEYRGYDSAGVALLEADGLHYVRAVGHSPTCSRPLLERPLDRDDGARPHALGDPRRASPSETRTR